MMAAVAMLNISTSMRLGSLQGTQQFAGAAGGWLDGSYSSNWPAVTDMAAVLLVSLGTHCRLLASEAGISSRSCHAPVRFDPSPGG